MKLTDAIPEKGFIREYVDFATPLTEAPTQMHFTNALVGIAGCAGRNVGLPWADGLLYPNIYKIDVGQSGISRKSTASNIAKRIIELANPGILLPDTQSLESFLCELRERPHRIAVYDEIKTFLDNTRKTYGEGLVALYTKVWDCPSFHRVRFQKILPEDGLIKDPCISIAAASTADWIEMAETDVQGGFLGRFLIFHIESEDRSLPIPAVAVKTDIERLARELKRITTIKGEFQFELDAKAHYTGLYNKHKEEWKKEENSRMSSFYSRLDVYGLKLAMIFQLSVNPEELLITKAHIERANLVIEQAREDYREVISSKIAITRDEKELNKIRGYIYQKAGIPYSPLLKNSHITAKRLKELLETLKESGEIHEDNKRYYPGIRTNSQ